MEELREQIRQIAQPALDRYNAELVDVILTKAAHRPTLRILVDKEGGITLDECSDINRELSDILDKTGIMKTSYVLEVSSPGLDRPLRTRRDFEKVAGEELNVHIKKPVEGKNFFQAMLDSVDEEFIILKKKDGRMLKIPYENIHKASLQIKI